MKKVFAGVQPRSSAASVRCLSILRKRGSTDRITYGRLKVVCAISMVIRPNFIGRKAIPDAATKRSIMETPVTISGFIIGMFVTEDIAVFKNLLFILSMPSAANVPITVARSEEETARISEFLSAFSACASRKSSLYQ